MSYRQSFGRWGEQAAIIYLLKNGFKIITQNWRSKYGEIDIIAQNDQCLVFVEVKTRRGNQYGYPEDAITLKKRSHLVNSALDYIEQNHIVNDWRIDIIAIQKDMNQQIKIEWFQDAIREDK